MSGAEPHLCPSKWGPVQVVNAMRQSTPPAAGHRWRVVRGVICLLGFGALSGCAGGPRPIGSVSRSTALECVPYARQVSGIQLFGDAADWWDAAAGVYRRTSQPSPGAVLVFERSGRLPHGHVSVVAGVRSGREITVTQANWVRGRIAHSEPVIDVSPGNDWSAVRVWWEPSNQIGTSVYPSYGFIQATPADPAAPDS